MAMLKIDGVELPTPSAYSPSLNEISKSERNANGTMIKEVIAYKTKIDCTWKKLNQTQMNIVSNIKKKNFFTLEYIDMSGVLKTGTFYCGDLKANAMNFRNGVIDGWLDVGLNFIER